MLLQELSKTTISGRKWHTSLFRKKSLTQISFPGIDTQPQDLGSQTSKFSRSLRSLEYFLFIALVSGGCVISGEINSQYSGF
jgi:hypothetical protein